MYFRALKSLFMNLKIKYKLLSAMMGIVLFSCSFMGIICYIYFSDFMEKEAKSETEASLMNTAASLDRDINLLYKDITYMVSNSGFIQTVMDIEYGNTENYASNYIAIQPLLNNVITHNILAENIIITGKNGEFYSTSNSGLKYSQEITHVLSRLKQEKGISWSPSISTPFPTMAEENIPISFPISLGVYGHAPLITNQEGDSSLSITVLIPTRKLEEYLNNFNRVRLTATYLTLEDGTILNRPQSYNQLNPASVKAMEEAISSASRLSTNHISTLDGDYFVSVNPLPFNRLKLVSTISKKELLSGIDRLKLFTSIAISASLLFSLFIGLALSRTLSLPLNKLTENVSTADPSRPLPMFHAKYQDEIGILSRTFDNLLNIIQKQMEQIKEDERQRYRTELEILTHQINPHFLYNTLECIHWEILGGNPESAALMVEKLGGFLRLSLNAQSSATTIQDELSHVEKYIDIINHRTQEPIDLLLFVSDGLELLPIVPRILQPFVENSIKHGFTSEDGGRLVMNPVISIRITEENGELLLVIEDNGKGIDIPAATAAVYQKDNSSKIGLNNVYRRLQVFYKSEIRIEFSSIPFHQNTITLYLPIKSESNDI